MRDSRTITSLRTNVSPKLSKYLMERDINKINIPSPNNRFSDLRKKTDVFSRVFKGSLVLTEGDSKLPPIKLISSSRALSSARKRIEFNSMYYHAGNVEKELNHLQKENREIIVKKHEAVKMKYNLKSKINLKLLELDNKDIAQFRALMRAQLNVISKDNEELKKEVDQLEKEVNFLKERIERVQAKTDRLDNFTNGAN